MSSTLTSDKVSGSKGKPAEASRPPHYLFLDGIRGLMALWVASGHALQDFIHVVNNHAGYAFFLPQPFFQQGLYAHFAVDVFIVLSGFCLMLPVARQPGLSLKGGWKTFLLRRAQRILPPYYAALLLAALLSFFRFQLTNPGVEASAIHTLDFRPTTLLAHLFLVQNMWDLWARGLDGPTWSVATECQIYLLFPLLLLPLWRRINPLWVILSATSLGLAVYWFTPVGLPSCSWYLGLFAMGMLGAQFTVKPVALRFQRLFGPVAITLIATGWLLVAFGNWMPLQMWALDLIFGSSTALLLTSLATGDTWIGNPLKSFLEWPPLVYLGVFSYSFYLIHAPLLYVPTTFLLTFDANRWVGAVVLGVSFVAIIFIARLFYLAIELPSIPGKKKG